MVSASGRHFGQQFPVANILIDEFASPPGSVATIRDKIGHLESGRLSLLQVHLYAAFSFNNL